MAKNLMESIAEDEEKLGNPEPKVTPNKEENTDGDESISPSGDQSDETSERGSATGAQDGGGGETGRAGRGTRSGRRGASGKPSGSTPQGEGGAPREDGKTSPRDSGGTRKDAGAPSEDARTSGRSDGERDEGVLDDKPPATGDHAAWAKLRREKRELEAQLRAVKGQPASTQTVKQDEAPKAGDKPAADPEPDRATKPEEWREWKDRQYDKELADSRAYREAQTRQQQETQIYTQAIGEFNQIRDSYIEKNPDYVPAFTYGYDTYAKSIKMMNPGLTNQQITGMIDRELLKFAGECVFKGLNPAEELYDMAIERFGYVPKSAKDEEAEQQEEPEENSREDIPAKKETPRPNLRTIANNRKRAASPLVGAGQTGKQQLSKESVANMTNGELLKLGPEDWAELERMGVG